MSCAPQQQLELNFEVFDDTFNGKVLDIDTCGYLQEVFRNKITDVLLEASDDKTPRFMGSHLYISE